MKRLMIITVVLFVMVSGFTSCTKCYSCNFGTANGGTQKVCKRSGPSAETDLKLEVQSYQNEGYVCTAD